jgi:DNA (cytosine-5)-methyltransferase 1
MLSVFESFSGYGGASFALKKIGVPHKIVGYSEIDKYAIKIYDANHNDIPHYGDITKINPETIPDFDLFTGGFPCQSFSSAGLGLGENDVRGTMFYYILSILSIKRPPLVLLENVKGLLSKRFKNTYNKIITELEKLGYMVFVKLLNTKDYGIPQNRDRVWIFATTSKNYENNFDFTPPKVITPKISLYLDPNPNTDLYLSNDQISRLIEIHHVDFDVPEPLCLDVYNKKIKYDAICPTLTEPHHNSIRIVEPMNNNKYIVRKLSIDEQFRLMGFADGEINYTNLSYTQLSKRAANGWEINLVSLILKTILKQYSN